MHFVKLTAAAALIMIAMPADAAPPKMDFHNLPAYMQALKQSTDPEAAHIYQEITGGPVALAYQEKLARAAGIPLTPAQMAQPTPPPRENAITLYAKLNALLQTKPLGLPRYAQPLDFYHAYTPQQLSIVQQIVASRCDVFDLTDQAAQKPFLVEPQKTLNSTFYIFPVFARLRESARELDTQSYLLTAQGHYMQAIQDQSLGYHVGNQASSSGGMIPDLVAVAIDYITSEGMQGILEKAGPNAVVDHQVEQAIVQNPPNLSLTKALQGEVVTYVNLMANPHPYHPAASKKAIATDPQPPYMNPAVVQINEDISDAVAARFLAYMRPLIIAISKPNQSQRAIDAELAITPNLGTASERASDPVLYLTQDIMELKYQRLADEFNEVSAREQVITAAASVLAVKANTGAFPKALPGRFIDPFDGKPLGYRTEGKNGFVVYSVGSKGDFNGGQPGQYTFTPPESFFRYPGPLLKVIPADEQN